MTPVTTIKALGDNYIFLIEYQKGKVLAIDPGQSNGIIKAVEQTGASLTTILITHHHFDHIGGVAKLKKRFNCQIIAPNPKIPHADRIVKDGDIINLAEVNIEVIATPGHTKDSVCYFLPAIGPITQPLVFTGDTLFTAGCGRVFETDMQTMYTSLTRLAKLPPDTIVHPGHDYTQENYRFALKNCDISTEKHILQLQQTNTQFTTIAQQLQTNVFLMAKNASEFGKLRQQKDKF